MKLRDVVTPPEREAAYLAAGLWDDTTLPMRVLAADPSAVAVVDVTSRHTYGELVRDAGAFAAHLAGNGVNAGDVVSIQLPNRYEAAVAAVATLSLAAVVNPLLPNYRQKEGGHGCTSAEPAAIVTPDAELVT